MKVRYDKIKQNPSIVAQTGHATVSVGFRLKRTHNTLTSEDIEGDDDDEEGM